MVDWSLTFSAPPTAPVERPTLSEIYEDSVRVNWHPIMHHGSTLKSAPEAFRLEVGTLVLFLYDSMPRL